MQASKMNLKIENLKFLGEMLELQQDLLLALRSECLNGIIKVLWNEFLGNYDFKENKRYSIIQASAIWEIDKNIAEEINLNVCYIPSASANNLFLEVAGKNVLLGTEIYPIVSGENFLYLAVKAIQNQKEKFKKDCEISDSFYRN